MKNEKDTSEWPYWIIQIEPKQYACDEKPWLSCRLRTESPCETAELQYYLDGKKKPYNRPEKTSRYQEDSIRDDVLRHLEEVIKVVVQQYAEAYKEIIG